MKRFTNDPYDKVEQNNYFGQKFQNFFVYVLYKCCIVLSTARYDSMTYAPASVLP